MRTITEIIIHCTATRPNAICTVESIRKYHRSLGWRDIGYHYVIYPDGSVHAGRPVEQPGAHTEGHNAHSIGIAYVAASMPTAIQPIPAPKPSASPSSSWCKT